MKPSFLLPIAFMLATILSSCHSREKVLESQVATLTRQLDSIEYADSTQHADSMFIGCTACPLPDYEPRALERAESDNVMMSELDRWDQSIKCVQDVDDLDCANGFYLDKNDLLNIICLGCKQNPNATGVFIRFGLSDVEHYTDNHNQPRTRRRLRPYVASATMNTAIDVSPLSMYATFGSPQNEINPYRPR